MIIKNIVIIETNGFLHIEELNTSTEKELTNTKEELKMSSIISDIIDSALADEKFIKRALRIKN